MLNIKDDYLIAEKALTAMLEACDQFKKVYSAHELGDVDERSQITPSAHVLYMGDSLPESAQGGATSQVKQTWLIVLACRLSIHERAAGGLIASTLNAIAGKTCRYGSDTIGPFKRINSPIKPRFTASHGYYPLAFSIQLKFNPNLSTATPLVLTKAKQ